MSTVCIGTDRVLARFLDGFRSEILQVAAAKTWLFDSAFQNFELLYQVALEVVQKFGELNHIIFHLWVTLSTDATQVSCAMAHNGVACSCYFSILVIDRFPSSHSISSCRSHLVLYGGSHREELLAPLV